LAKAQWAQDSDVTTSPTRQLDEARSNWLINGRWISVAGAVATVVLGRRISASGPSLLQAAIVAGVMALTNLILWRRTRNSGLLSVHTAGTWLAIDVLVISGWLARSGAVLNPRATFYLVEVVFAALVLGQAWAWFIAGLSVAGYAVLFAAPDHELHAAQAMHPVVGAHMQGMWIAFAVTAITLAFLATRLVAALERSNAEIARLRDRSAREVRAESLANAVAGAAHELASPLATMAVAAHEMERQLKQIDGMQDLLADVNLIRSQVTRCREILDQMSGHVGGPVGECAQHTAVSDVIAAAISRLGEADRGRVVVEVPEMPLVRWPTRLTEQLVGHLLRNAIQASSGDQIVNVIAGPYRAGIEIKVSDLGTGITPDVLIRVGEPFFTTKPIGEGMGLGLFVVKASAEALHGELKFRSIQGRGTTATLWLPTDVATSVESP